MIKQWSKSVHLSGCLLLPALAGYACSQSDEGRQLQPAEWIVLFPDQDWNDFPQEDIQTFSGVVGYEANDPLPSYVQRHNPYKLIMDSGTIDIYMGSSDELRSLVGEEIEIRGCIVNVEVEGQCFIEIWPVEYRKTEF